MEIYIKLSGKILSELSLGFHININNNKICITVQIGLKGKQVKRAKKQYYIPINIMKHIK